jgi:hypothetical protein
MTDRKTRDQLHRQPNCSTEELLQQLQSPAEPMHNPNEIYNVEMSDYTSSQPFVPLSQMTQSQSEPKADKQTGPSNIKLAYADFVQLAHSKQ